jgi:Effector protein/RTX calcium-binding nonapeptide repeat (4 copies)
MHVTWRALRRFVRRALLSFGPVIAVTAGFVGVGAYASSCPQPSPVPDLGLLHEMTPLLASRVDCVPAVGTAGDDVILISRSGNARVTVTVNGQRSEYLVRDDRPLAVRGRGGDDTVKVLGDLPVALVLSGGGGDDTLVAGSGDDLLDGGPGDDIIEGGAGDDLVDAGAGDDVVVLGSGRDEADGGDGRDALAGGAGDDYLQGGRGADVVGGGGGDDVLYGLGGRDRLRGGAGADYLDGGAGDDHVAGEGGRDVVFGGSGDDVLRDLAGGDLLAGGDGRDACLAGAGSRIVAPAADEWPRLSGVVRVVDGRHGLAARAASDLEALRSLPLGRELLAELAASGRAVVLRATADGNAITWDLTAGGCASDSGQPGPGASSVVLYNPYRTVVGDGRSAWQHRPPIVGLFHELVHALAVAQGTMPSEDARRQAQAIGADGPAPKAPTENGLRAFLGLPLRPLE